MFDLLSSEVLNLNADPAKEMGSQSPQSPKAGWWEWNVAEDTEVWSKEMYDLYGVPHDVSIGKGFVFSRLHPEDYDRVTQHVTACLAARQSHWVDEFRIENPARGTVWIAGYAYVTYDASGRPLRMVGLNVDITERKKAEERREKDLQEIALTNRIFQVFVEETGDDLFDKVLNIVLEGMRSRHGVFGYLPKPGYLVCPSMTKMLDQCKVTEKCIRYPLEKWKGLWARALREKRSFYTNEPPVVPPGHVPIRNNLATPILFRGEAIGLLNLANKDEGYDETDRKLLERIAVRIAPVLYAWIQRQLRDDEREAAAQALRESEERLNRSQEIAHLGSWEMDLVQNRLMWSDEVYRIFGLAPREFGATYEAFLERVHPDDRAIVDAAYMGSVRESRNTYEVEHRIIRKDTGTVRIVHERCQHFRDAAGTIVRSVGMVHDITERTRLEAELRKAKTDLELRVRERTLELEQAVAELRRSNLDLQQFAYVASHDLQEPLRMVASFVQLLAEQYQDRVDEDGRQYIRYAVEGAARMGTLIRDLLEYSRVNTRGRGFEPIDGNILLTEAIRNLTLPIEETGARITHDPLPVVRGDRTQLVQVLQNLIGNAIKFRGDQPPRIHVGIESKDGEWLFSVRDNGIGIAPEFLDRIFIIFQRLHTRTKYNGNGIGLAIVKRIVERHNGRIYVASQPGEGTTFFFTIPINQKVT